MHAAPSIRKLGLALGSTLIGLVCLEVGLRLALPAEVAPRPRRFFARVPGLPPDQPLVPLPGWPLLNGAPTGYPHIAVEFPPDLRFQVRYDAGENREHAYMDYADQWFTLDVEINAAGFRGPLPREPKPAGVPRVVCVGDSFTFGDGVLEKDTWVRELSDAFQAGGGRSELESLNLGVPGYDSSDVAASVVLKTPALDPDLVIWAVVLNDPPSNDGPRLQLLQRLRAALRATQAAPDGLARDSRLLAVLQKHARQSELAATYREFLLTGFEPGSISWNTFRSDLAAMRDELAARGVRFLVMVFPVLEGLEGDYAFGPAHDRVRAACDELGVPELDLLSAFHGQHDTDLWVHPKDWHPNPLGHHIAAQALGAYLAAHAAELLPTSANR